MTKEQALLKFEMKLAILVRRKNNLQKELEQIDSVSLGQETENLIKRWHEVFGKIKILEDRIATIKSSMEILANKRDFIKDVISSGKSVFNSIFSSNLGVR